MKITSRNEENITIMGVDSSTTGVAWTLIKIVDGSPVPVEWGKIKLDGKKEMMDKMGLVAEHFTPLVYHHQPDHIFIEKSIFVKNPDTARKLSFVVGALMVIAAQQDKPVTLVEPASWKAFTKYRNLTRKMVDSAVSKLGKTEGKKFCDKLRKVQTSRVLQHCYPSWTIDYSDHDIVDSCGIALYGVNQLSMEINLEIPPFGLLSQEELDIVGS